MGVMRSLLLAGSQNPWLARQATRQPFVRRAVSRFMPGESMDEALAAARGLEARRIGTILTHLGENVHDAAEVAAESDHYLRLLERIGKDDLDAEASVKLTQLGLDLDPEMAYRSLAHIAGYARRPGTTLWIDMEGSPYTEITVKTYERLHGDGLQAGLAIQAYLKRTLADVERLVPLAPWLRLVKGAYREPGTIALQRRHDIDERFFELAVRLLADDARAQGVRLTVATHDPVLIRRVERHVAERKIDRRAFEFAMLYGIQTEEQTRLANAGYRVRVLISYGSQWFPWYMRRLAEKPSNVLLVARNVLGARAPAAG